jgi:hypothetical protein
MKKNILVILMLLHCSASFAASQWCTSKVTNLFIVNSGEVTANYGFRGEYLSVCNLNSEWKGISPTTCAAWYSILKTAVSRQSDVTLHYPGEQISACNTIPTYGSSPAPYYVMLVN